MAEADFENTPSDWTVDDAFRYLTKTVGLRDYDAIHQMTERIRTGRLPVCVDGLSPPPTLWIMGQLVLTIDADGRAEVTPTAAMEPWPCVFTVRERDVRMLSWELPADKPTAKPAATELPEIEPFRTGGAGRPSAQEFIVAEFERRVAAREVIPRLRGLQAECRHLAKWWEGERRQYSPPGPAMAPGTIEIKIRSRWNKLASKN
jgi:hypothetical protein